MGSREVSPSEYDAAYYGGGGSSNYQDYAEQEKLLESYWLPLVERYRRVMGAPGPGRCLDVGCAYGFLVEAYRRLGWEAQGCDVSQYAIEQGQRRGIRGLQLGALTDLDYPDGGFDLVTCLDVTEHLDAATYGAYRAALHRIVKPGGVLFVATPNAIDCSGFNVFSPDWVEGDATHINYRSARELEDDFRDFERVVIQGSTPSRGLFGSYRSLKGLPRRANGLLRWFLWRMLGNDVRHSAYLLLVARR
jgi:SAM-dependent methyltransferase